MFIDWILISAVALVAAISAILVGKLAIAFAPDPQEGPPVVAHGLFDASAVAFLSPMIAFLVAVFIATLVPSLFTMIPFFLIWMLVQRAERRHHEDEVLGSMGPGSGRPINAA